MAQDVDSPPNITILEHELEFLHDFVYRYFGSTISDTLSLDSKLMVQQDVLSTLLYGSESFTTSAHCAGRSVIPELVFSATQGAVREQPI